METKLLLTTVCFCLLITIFLFRRMSGVPSKSYFPVHGRTVLITGGSQGLGKSAACKLSNKGANVIIVARNIEKLQLAVEEISAAALDSSSQRFHYISADLTNPSSASRVLAEATTWNDNVPPSIIWCCAGSSHPGLFIETPISTLQEQMDTNFFSAATIVHAALQSWLLTNPSPSRPDSKTKLAPANHIIFTSSVLSFYPIAGYGPYSPCKAAIRSLSDTLSQELKLYPWLEIKVHTLFPATIFSPALALENSRKHAITKALEEGDGGQTPDEAAESCIRGLERGEELVTTGWLGWAMKVGMLGASPRGLLDIVGGAVVAFVMPFVRKDMDGTVVKWEEENRRQLAAKPLREQ